MRWERLSPSLGPVDSHTPYTQYTALLSMVRTPWEQLRLSRVDLTSGGQREVKACAARRVVGSPQAAAVRFDDGAADGESHTSSIRLSSKERFEDLVHLVGRQSHAGITHRHHNFLVFRPLRPDRKFASGIHVLDGIDAIEHEVHEHLLQLHPISHYLVKIC